MMIEWIIERGILLSTFQVCRFIYLFTLVVRDLHPFVTHWDYLYRHPLLAHLFNPGSFLPAII